MMTPEGRIGFECTFATVTFAFIIARTILLRYENPRMTKTIRTSLVVTNFTLWTAATCLIINFSASIWAMSKIIQYRNQTEIPVVPYFDLPLHLVEPSLKLAFVVKFAYMTGIYMVKGAFLGLFLKFIQHVSTRVRYALRIVIVTTFLCYILNIVLIIAWCRPISRNWEYGPGLCSAFHTVPVAVIQTVTNVVTDFAIMAVPFLILKSLKLRNREMWGLAFVFVLGLACIVVALVRFYFLYDFITHKDGSPPSQNNPIVILSEVEAFVAVVAGCLPAMRALISKRRSRSKAQASELTDGNNPAKAGYRKKEADEETWSPAIAMKSPPMSPKAFKSLHITTPSSPNRPMPQRQVSYGFDPPTFNANNTPTFIPLQPQAGNPKRNSKADSNDTSLSARESEWRFFSQNVGDDEDTEAKGLRPSPKWS